MIKMVHTIDIVSVWVDCFEKINDVDSWPSFMPAVTHGKKIRSLGGTEVVQITANFNDSTRSWQSKRKISRDTQTIKFEQENPKAPIEVMRGYWEFEQNGWFTHVKLVHEFRATNLSYEDAIKTSIRSNAKSDLLGLKNIIQKGIKLDQSKSA